MLQCRVKQISQPIGNYGLSYLIQCNKHPTVSAPPPIAHYPQLSVGALSGEHLTRILSCIQNIFRFCDCILRSSSNRGMTIGPALAGTLLCCLGQWGSSHMAWVWRLWMGEGLFSFNIASEPISKSGTEWIQLSSTQTIPSSTLQQATIHFHRVENGFRWKQWNGPVHNYRKAPGRLVLYTVTYCKPFEHCCSTHFPNISNEDRFF